jgi:hypothetical protein
MLPGTVLTIRSCFLEDTQYGEDMRQENLHGQDCKQSIHTVPSYTTVHNS